MMIFWIITKDNNHSLIFIIWPSNASNSTNTRLEKRGKNTCFPWSCKILQVSSSGVCAGRWLWSFTPLSSRPWGDPWGNSNKPERHRKTENSPKLFKTDVKIALELQMIWNLGKDGKGIWGSCGSLWRFCVSDLLPGSWSCTAHMRRSSIRAHEFIVRRLFNGRRLTLSLVWFAPMLTVCEAIW